jgi:hypothetical protein
MAIFRTRFEDVAVFGYEAAEWAGDDAAAGFQTSDIAISAAATPRSMFGLNTGYLHITSTQRDIPAIYQRMEDAESVRNPVLAPFAQHSRPWLDPTPAIGSAVGGADGVDHVGAVEAEALACLVEIALGPVGEPAVVDGSCCP